MPASYAIQRRPLVVKTRRPWCDLQRESVLATGGAATKKARLPATRGSSVGLAPASSRGLVVAVGRAEAALAVEAAPEAEVLLAAGVVVGEEAE